MPSKTIDNMNVLIIDDDRHMRMLIRNVLFALGVKDVAEAIDGEGGLEQMQGYRPHLILCDLKMEPMGGLEFVRRLRSDVDNPNRLVPIIMITAYAELETVAQARDTGVNEFMAKPLSATSLDNRIQRVLKDPRGFVESENFSGPDRRRNKFAHATEPERRVLEPCFLEVGSPTETE